MWSYSICFSSHWWKWVWRFLFMLQRVLGWGYPTPINTFVFRIRVQVTIMKPIICMVLLVYSSNTHVQNWIPIVLAENSLWPSSKTLILLRLWTMIFPCSDYNHVVITPTILLMCEYLMRCPILTCRDIAIGAFLCSLLLSVCWVNYDHFILFCA